MIARSWFVILKNMYVLWLWHQLWLEIYRHDQIMKKYWVIFVNKTHVSPLYHNTSKESEKRTSLMAMKFRKWSYSKQQMFKAFQEKQHIQNDELQIGVIIISSLNDVSDGTRVIEQILFSGFSDHDILPIYLKCINLSQEVWMMLVK